MRDCEKGENKRELRRERRCERDTGGYGYVFKLLYVFGRRPSFFRVMYLAEGQSFFLELCNWPKAKFLFFLELCIWRKAKCF